MLDAVTKCKFLSLFITLFSNISQQLLCWLEAEKGMENPASSRYKPQGCSNIGGGTQNASLLGADGVYVLLKIFTFHLALCWRGTAKIILLQLRNSPLFSASSEHIQFWLSASTDAVVQKNPSKNKLTLVWQHKKNACAPGVGADQGDSPWPHKMLTSHVKIRKPRWSGFHIWPLCFFGVWGTICGHFHRCTIIIII